MTFGDLSKLYHTGAVYVLHRQNDLDAHVLSLMHNLPINQDLISANPIAHHIRRVSTRGDLDLPPFAVGGHELPLGSAILKFTVYTLFIDASLPLNQGRSY